MCGLHPVRDVQLCINLKVSMLGFVFYEKSPRNINPEEVKILKKYEKRSSSYVAVCVNPSNEFIENIVQKHFDYIQLHGAETKKRVEEIKSMGLKIIKAIKIIKNNQKKDKLLITILSVFFWYFLWG